MKRRGLVLLAPAFGAVAAGLLIARVMVEMGPRLTVSTGPSSATQLGALKISWVGGHVVCAALAVATAALLQGADRSRRWLWLFSAVAAGWAGATALMLIFHLVTGTSFAVVNLLLFAAYGAPPMVAALWLAHDAAAAARPRARILKTLLLFAGWTGCQALSPPG